MLTFFWVEARPSRGHIFTDTMAAGLSPSPRERKSEPSETFLLASSNKSQIDKAAKDKSAKLSDTFNVTSLCKTE